MKRQFGFTILEFIIATFIFAVVAAGAAIFATYYFQSYSLSFDEHQAVNQAQLGLTTMIREIRETRTGDDGAWPIAQADDNQFIFYSDVTNDGRSDRVRYYLSGTNLQKGIIEPTQVPVSYPPENEKNSTIASGVDISLGPLFIYYNGSWPSDTINNPLPANQRQLSTRFVTINLRINIASGSASRIQPFQLTSGVQIRSLKDNL